MNDNIQSVDLLTDKSAQDILSQYVPSNFYGNSSTQELNPLPTVKSEIIDYIDRSIKLIAKGQAASQGPKWVIANPSKRDLAQGLKYAVRWKIGKTRSNFDKVLSDLNKTPRQQVAVRTYDDGVKVLQAYANLYRNNNTAVCACMKETWKRFNKTNPNDPTKPMGKDWKT